MARFDRLQSFCQGPHLALRGHLDLCRLKVMGQSLGPT